MPLGDHEPRLGVLDAGRAGEHREEGLSSHRAHRRGARAGRQAGVLAGARRAAGLAILLGAACAGPLATARRAVDDGDFGRASAVLRAATAEDPTDPELWFALGHAELGAERPARAREAFERVAALEPRRARARVWIGATYELERRWDDARLAYEHACSTAPSDPAPFRLLGERLLRWGEPARAIEPLRRVIELEPGDAGAWNAVALAEHASGDLPAAERTFRDGRARHPGARPLHLGLAAMLVNAARHAEALAIYDDVVRRWPAFAPAHVGRAILLHELGRPDDAEAAFASAIGVAADPAPYERRLEAYRRLRVGARGDGEGSGVAPSP